MKRLNSLSRAEMKKIMGGLRDGELCDASNGTYYTSICVGGYYFNETTGHYEWAPSYVSPTTPGYDPSAPCGGVCQGTCTSYYACDDQYVT